ncbi:MAG TPA: hypothetical protein PKA06_15165, partial [Gemmatales bacterium]|nr:hypothetical protein [Gemmatales bacterium]
MAALAFERAGDQANKTKALGLLTSKLRGNRESLPPALRNWDEEKLLASLKSPATTRLAIGQNDWRLFMGSADRAARSNSTMPFMEPLYPAVSISEPGQA